jgi:branched-chain amino acid aminotransferase
LALQGDQRGQHRPRASNRLGPATAKHFAQAVTQGGAHLCLGVAPGIGEQQAAGAAVIQGRLARDQVGFFKVGQDPRQALFAHPKRILELADPQAGLAPDRTQGAVMGAAEAKIAQRRFSRAPISAHRGEQIGAGAVEVGFTQIKPGFGIGAGRGSGQGAVRIQIAAALVDSSRTAEEWCARNSNSSAKEPGMAEAPYHDRDGWIWMNGGLVPWREANVHVLTHALHYASAVFEGERAYDGEIFESRRHSERLHKSARLLGFDIPYSVEALDAAKADVVAKSGLGDAYLRAIAWRGSEKMGVSAQTNRINVAIAAWHWGDYFPDRMKGIRLMMAPWARPSPHTAPCEAKAAGLYMICTLSKHAAENAGFQDALMLDWRGQVAEATGANIFFVRDGAIHTPTADVFLNGITRQTVIELARQRKYEVIERPIWPNELANFSEVWLTGSAAEISPVREIAGMTFKPGAITETMIDDYSRLVRRKNR